MLDRPGAGRSRAARAHRAGSHAGRQAVGLDRGGARTARRGGAGSRRRRRPGIRRLPRRGERGQRRAGRGLRSRRPGEGASADLALRREPAHREAFVRLRKAQVEFPQILSAFDGVAQWIGVAGPGDRGLAARGLLHRLHGRRARATRSATSPSRSLDQRRERRDEDRETDDERNEQRVVPEPGGRAHDDQQGRLPRRLRQERDDAGRRHDHGERPDVPRARPPGRPGGAAPSGRPSSPNSAAAPSTVDARYAGEGEQGDRHHQREHGGPEQIGQGQRAFGAQAELDLGRVAALRCLNALAAAGGAPLGRRGLVDRRAAAARSTARPARRSSVPARPSARTVKAATLRTVAQPPVPAGRAAVRDFGPRSLRGPSSIRGRT